MSKQHEADELEELDLDSLDENNEPFDKSRAIRMIIARGRAHAQGAHKGYVCLQVYCRTEQEAQLLVQSWGGNYYPKNGHHYQWVLGNKYYQLVLWQDIENAMTNSAIKRLYPLINRLGVVAHLASPTSGLVLASAAS